MDIYTIKSKNNANTKANDKNITMPVTKIIGRNETEKGF
jgi:hypothetical protein